MRLMIMLVLALSSASVLGTDLEIKGTLRLFEQQSGDQSRVAIRTIGEFEVRRGYYEWHVREGNPHYRGVPWNLIVGLDPATQNAQVTFWIDDADLQFGEDDDAIVQEEFHVGNFEPRNFKLDSFPDGSLIQLSLVPKSIPEALPPAPLTALDAGLTRFCLKHSKVLMDDTFVLGSITGFGEKLVIDVPERAVVSLSMEPIHDWRPIGTYENGVISVPMTGGHQLSISGVRIGPMGNDPGGPYVVYGSIEASQASLPEVRDRVEERLKQQHSGERLEALLQAFRANPFGALGRVTVGSDRDPSEHLERRAGPFGEELSACSVAD